MANPDAKPSSATAASRPAPTTNKPRFHGSQCRDEFRWIVHDERVDPCFVEPRPVERVVHGPRDDRNPTSVSRSTTRSVTRAWCRTRVEARSGQEQAADDRHEGRAPRRARFDQSA